MPVPRPELIAVWWHDAHSTQKAFDDKDIDSYHGPYVVCTAGWKLRDDEKGITVAYSWNPPSEGEIAFEKWDYRDIHFFPRDMIVRVEQFSDGKEVQMPRVGMKHYSYGPKGMKAARAEARRTGKKVVVTKTTRRKR